ncbi:MAG: flagellar biosynthesis protein FlhF [Syntrophomonadaceae bacterium]|nr:flagellar biosynthesis protein FlhF [Syntrophomonadaceae bacterium]
MKIRRFVADSFQKAMYMAKRELGQDALIIHTRKFKQGGFLGFFAKPRVEITVAVDEEMLEQNSEPAEPEPGADSNTAPEISAYETQQDEDKPSAVGEQFAAASDNVPIPLPDAGDETPAQPILEELQLVKEMVAEMNCKLNSNNRLQSYPRHLQQMYNSLVNHRVEEKLAVEIINRVRLSLSQQEQLLEPERAREMCLQIIVSMIRKPWPIELNQGRPRVVAMVGPTGVGKTTTIAKLAANFALLEKKQVGLVTLDTYRIAAVEQLRTYAEIIGIPLEVAFRARELGEALHKLRHRDLILLDTAGRNPRDQRQISELGEFIQVSKPDEVMLVLNTNTHTSDLLDIYRRFNVIKIDKVIFTKVDESEYHGQILNVLYNTRTNLAYITNGQNVPDDIEVPDPIHLAQLILEEGRDNA